MERRISLSKAEALLVDMAHSEATIAHRATEQLLQSRLAAITDQYEIKDGTEISFERDGSHVILSFDDGIASLKVVNSADATVHFDEDDGA